MGTLKLQSKGPLYSNVLGTLAVDGWAVTFGTARRGLGGLSFSISLLIMASYCYFYRYSDTLDSTGEQHGGACSCTRPVKTGG